MLYTNIDDITASYYKPREDIEKVCPICGETFYTTKRNKIYCSPECCSEAIRRKAVEWAKSHPDVHRARSIEQSRNRSRLRGSAYYKARLEDLRKMFADGESDEHIMDYLYANFRRKNATERAVAQKELKKGEE